MTADQASLLISAGGSQAIRWSVENEIHLFDALTGYKPVGVSKHFQMLAILERFCSRVRRDVPANVIWDRLNQLYDMSALDELEDVPFPNAEIEFGLPAEFDTLVQERLRSGTGQLEGGSGNGEEPHAPAADHRRSRALERSCISMPREKQRSETSEVLRRAPKRAATRDVTGGSASPAATPPVKRSRRT